MSITMSKVLAEGQISIGEETQKNPRGDVSDYSH